MITHPIALAVLYACYACSPGEPPASVIDVVDSAGVSIIIHRGATGGHLVASSDPDLVVGRGTGGDDELFRVLGGLLSPDGRVVIANGGSQELLYLASNGTVLRRVGGEGQGPGEFTNIFWIQGRDDGSVVVYDAGNLRLVEYDRAGDMVHSRNVRFEPEEESSGRAIVGPGFPIGVFADDHVAAVPWAAARFSGVEGPLPLKGELRDYDPELAAFNRLDSVQLRTWYEAPQLQGPPIEQMLEAPTFLFSAHGPRVAYSDAQTYRVTVLEGDKPSQVILENRTRIPFSPDSLPDHIHHAADSLPAYRALIVDSDGRIWIRPSLVQADGEVEWRVVSRDGRRIDVIKLPESTSMLDASDDKILLLERDEFDVETVAVRRIR